MFIARLSPNNLNLKIESFSVSDMEFFFINLGANVVVPGMHYINYIHLNLLPIAIVLFVDME